MTECKHQGCETSVIASRGYCNVHYLRFKRGTDMDAPVRVNYATVQDRFWAKVDKSGECWIWQGGKSREGYGSFRFKGASRLAHRVAYELSVGPIPQGLQIDHLCRVRSCVNPAHLESVTQQENIRRGESGAHHASKKECPHGHPYSAVNTYVDSRNRRHCRTCHAARTKSFYQRKRETQTDEGRAA